jgi:hypothetical protein
MATCHCGIKQVCSHGVCYGSMDSDPNCVIFNWNVCGLNNPARRQVVRDLTQEHGCTIACLQETKIQHISDAIVAETFRAMLH